MRITALVGGITLAAGVMIGWKVNGWRLEARIADIQTSHAIAYAQAQKAARDKENALTNDLATLRKSRDAEVTNISNRLADALNSLRNRPQRPAGGVPTDSPFGSGSVQGCTGSQLYREDAEVALRIARDADELRVAYKTCAGAYEAARKALE